MLAKDDPCVLQGRHIVPAPSCASSDGYDKPLNLLLLLLYYSQGYVAIHTWRGQKERPISARARARTHARTTHVCQPLLLEHLYAPLQPRIHVHTHTHIPTHMCTRTHTQQDTYTHSRTHSHSLTHTAHTEERAKKTGAQECSVCLRDRMQGLGVR
jgi:hypothetical protein